MVQENDKDKEVQFKVIDIGLADQRDRRTILIVDDDPSLQSVMFDTLSDYYRLILASNGREAIAKAKDMHPQLILMDVMMPDIGGYEAVRQLQNIPETKDIPVFMITAMDFDPSTVDMFKNESNVKGFIHKPFRPKKLREIIASILPPDPS